MRTHYVTGGNVLPRPPGARHAKIGKRLFFAGMPPLLLVFVLLLFHPITLVLGIAAIIGGFMLAQH